MTTEEMNRVIAEYVGYVRYKQTSLWENYSTPVGGRPALQIEEAEFQISWDWLMPVWQKLRGELKQYGYLYNDQQARIGHAILDTDITTAHRLIVEAIELIKK